jgi:hypothetical protein
MLESSADLLDWQEEEANSSGGPSELEAIRPLDADRGQFYRVRKVAP